MYALILLMVVLLIRLFSLGKKQGLTVNDVCHNWYSDVNKVLMSVRETRKEFCVEKDYPLIR